MELERRIKGYSPFVCLLGCLLLYDSPYKSGCPSRRKTGKVCNSSTSSLSSNGQKIPFKTILKLIIVKANIPRVVCVHRQTGAFLASSLQLCEGDIILMAICRQRR